MSLNPGVQQYGALEGGHVTTPDGTVKAGQPISSVTQDPMTPVEYGRVAAGSKYTTTPSGGAEIDGVVPVGPVVGVTLVTTVSVQGDGARTGVATTSNLAGTNATVSYTVTGGVASAASVVNAGTGYSAGEILTVADDTGVTLSVTI